MKYFWFGILLFLLFTGIVYVVPSLHAKASMALSYSPCDTPLPYRLGNVDKRFGLTTDEVLNDMQNAGNIWSDEEGKKLFTYSPQATLTVNFVYDKRQELTTSINALNSQLKQNSTSLDKQIAQYQTDVAAFQQKLADFNATVDKYNASGGAPPDVYNQLKQEQKDLDAQGNALNERAKQLNLSTNNYNANVATFNSDIAQFNSALKQKPEEGLYNGGDNTITIYIFDTQQDLLHTLTHEFGHALGMIHVSDPHAIMYPYTTPSLFLTDDDKKQLAYVCRQQSRLLHYLDLLDMWITDFVHNVHRAIIKK